MSKEKQHILDLINKIKLFGDNDAFIEINELYKNLCYNIAYSIYIYEDFEQDKNVVILESVKKYDPEKCAYGTYLANQIKYLCFKKRNELKVKPQLYASGLLIDQLDNNQSQEFLYDKNIEFNIDYEHDDNIKLVIDKVNSLNEDDRKLFYLRYNDGLSWRDVGKQMGMSGQAALNWHSKLIKQIRKDIPELID